MAYELDETHQVVFVDNVAYCKHCGKKAIRESEIYDHYDVEEWYTCDCAVAQMVSERRNEL